MSAFTSIIQKERPETLAELKEVIASFEETARAEGHDPDTVFFVAHRLELERETLSDGSEVMNIRPWEYR